MRWLSFLFILSIAHAYVASGEATITSQGGLGTIGFDLKTGSVTGNEGDFYYLDQELWTNHATAGIKEMGGEVDSCDLSGYLPNSRVSEGMVYCIKAKDGSYGKIKVTSKTDQSLTFNWFHQRDGTNLFTEETELINDGFDINYLLIGLIIILAVIIVLLWKYR